MSRLAQSRQQRLEKVEQLKKLGIHPYPAQSQKDFSNKEIVDNFDKHEGKTVTLAGRLMFWRKHGKITFGQLQDQTGRIQLFIYNKVLEETNSEKQILGYSDLNLLDLGDFIQVTGEVLKTKTGEVSIQPTQIKLLTKSIRPLPSKWGELKDPETIFRRRYLDLVMSPQRRDLFERKAKFWEVQRAFMKSKGFIEVEVPVLEHVTGGADARPFVTHMNALSQDFYLRISTELYQKRLVGGGFEKIFTLAPNFRNEGLSDEHLPEYYQLEWYWAYADYRDNMNFVKEMFRDTAQKVYGKTKFTKGSHTFDLADKWEEIDYPVVIKERFGLDIFKSPDEDFKKVLDEHKISLSDGAITRNRLIDNVWKIIRKEISGPAFLINEPAFMSPLSKSKIDNPELTERFHIVIAGSELGNGYSELNDPIDQFNRFRDQQEGRDSGDEESQMMDIDYVEMLEYGMPPTSGYAHSERLFWFLENVTAREGTLFPQLKHKLEETTKEIYNLGSHSKKSNDSGVDKSNHQPFYPTLKDSNILNISPEAAEKYPSVKLGIAVIRGVSIEKTNDLLESKKAEYLEFLNPLQKDDVENFVQLQSYRRMYKDMGVDFHSRRPSPEALLRRVVQGKDLYNVNTCVDAYNLIVMKNKVSIGAFDYDQFQFPSELRIAKGGEKIHLLGNDDETELKEGEVHYADKVGPYNLDFNYRDAVRTAITEDTKDIIINVDGVYGITRHQVEQSLKETIEIITEICGGELEMVGVVLPK